MHYLPITATYIYDFACLLCFERKRQEFGNHSSGEFIFGLHPQLFLRARLIAYSYNTLKFSNCTFPLTRSFRNLKSIGASTKETHISPLKFYFGHSEKYFALTFPASHFWLHSAFRYPGCAAHCFQRALTISNQASVLITATTLIISWWYLRVLARLVNPVPLFWELASALNSFHPQTGFCVDSCYNGCSYFPASSPKLSQFCILRTVFRDACPFLAAEQTKTSLDFSPALIFSNEFLCTLVVYMQIFWNLVYPVPLSNELASISIFPNRFCANSASVVFKLNQMYPLFGNLIRKLAENVVDVPVILLLGDLCGGKYVCFPELFPMLISC